MRNGELHHSDSFFNSRIFAALSITVIAVLLGAIATVIQFNALQSHSWYELAFQQLRDDARAINIRAYQLVFAPTSDARLEAETELRQSLTNLAHDIEVIASTDNDGREGGKLTRLKNDYPWLFDDYKNTQQNIAVFLAFNRDIELPENLDALWEDRADEFDFGGDEGDDEATDYSQYAVNDWNPALATDKVEALSFTLLDLGGQLAVPDTDGGQNHLNLGNKIWRITESKIIPALTVLTSIVTKTRQEKQRSLQVILLVSAFIILVAAGINTFLIFLPMRRTIGETHAALAEAAQKAQSADKAKSTFLANMSHEIRTPINGILGMAQILDRGNLDARHKDFVRMLIDSGKNLLVIINDILDFSRIEAGQINLSPKETDLGRLVEETVVALSISQSPDSRVEIIVKVQPNLPRTVLVDAERLRQILTNLFGNAMKFTENGHILTELSGEVTDTGNLKTTIRVTDTGCGIDAETLPNLFTRFTQANTERDRVREGSGLGLSICKQLTELMGGEIKAFSHVNLGSCFTVTFELPIVDTAADAYAFLNTLDQRRCLIVEENALVRDCVAGYLETWGLMSYMASSIADGISKVQQLNLPPESRMYIIVSADILEREKTELEKLYAEVGTVYTIVTQWRGATERKPTKDVSYLYKPFSRDQLIQELETGLKTPEAQNPNTPSEETQEQQSRLVNSDGTNTGLTIVRSENMVKTTNRALPSSTASSASSLLTLLVDDNLMNRRVGTEILSLLDQQFITAENGQEALELVKSRRPDIVLMDVSMPVLDGLEATRMIRSMETDISQPVIIGMTAHAMPEDRKKCFEHGMDDYLSKPISFDEMEILYVKWAKHERKA